VANEAFARVTIDRLSNGTDLALTYGHGVRFEYPLDDGGRGRHALTLKLDHPSRAGQLVPPKWRIAVRWWLDDRRMHDQ